MQIEECFYCAGALLYIEHFDMTLFTIYSVDMCRGCRLAIGCMIVAHTLCEN